MRLHSSITISEEGDVFDSSERLETLDLLDREMTDIALADLFDDEAGMDVDEDEAWAV